MATQSATTRFNLLEWARRMTKGHESVLTTVEVMDETNELLQHAPWFEANEKWTNRVNRRTYLPQGSLRGFNEGVLPDYSQTKNVVDVIAMLETYAIADKALVGSDMELRTAEARAFIEGMTQQLVYRFVYGNNSTNPLDMTGLAARMATPNGSYIVDAGGSGSDCTSIYVVMWGIGMTHFIFPPAHPTMGIEHENLDQVTETDTTGRKHETWQDHFSTYFGLAVANPKSIGRVGSIETTYGASNSFDEDDLIQVIEAMPAGRKSIYVPKNIKTQMRLTEKDKLSPINYADDMLSGRHIMHFGEDPVYTLEQISTAEDAI